MTDKVLRFRQRFINSNSDYQTFMQAFAFKIYADKTVATAQHTVTSSGTVTMLGTDYLPTERIDAGYLIATDGAIVVNSNGQGSQTLDFWIKRTENASRAFYESLFSKINTGYSFFATQLSGSSFISTTAYRGRTTFPNLGYLTPSTYRGLRDDPSVSPNYSPPTSENFYARSQTVFVAPTTKNYTFSSSGVDDYFAVSVNGTQVLNNATGTSSTSITLNAGSYPMTVDIGNGSGPWGANFMVDGVTYIAPGLSSEDVWIDANGNLQSNFFKSQFYINGVATTLGNSSIPVGVWTHVAVTYPTDYCNFAFGQNAYAQKHNGLQIAGISTSSRALAATEIAQKYNSTFANRLLSVQDGQITFTDLGATLYKYTWEVTGG